jgi:hypothetical protein
LSTSENDALGTDLYVALDSIGNLLAPPKDASTPYITHRSNLLRFIRLMGERRIPFAVYHVRPCYTAGNLHSTHRTTPDTPVFPNSIVFPVGFVDVALANFKGGLSSRPSHELLHSELWVR